MVEQFRRIFTRHNVFSLQEIVIWWFRGTYQLNMFFILYAATHLFLVATVIGNGWFVLLVVPIFFLGLLVNLLFVSGLFIELFVTRLLRQEFDFNKYGPIIKKSALITCIAMVLILSVLDLLRQW